MDKPPEFKNGKSAFGSLAFPSLLLKQFGYDIITSSAGGETLGG
jgi:hypothetical protein